MTSMVWLNFDLLRYEAVLFGSDLNDLAAAIYSAAQRAIESVHSHHIEELKRQQESSKDEDESQILWQAEQWEQERYFQQMYALTAMTLSLISSRVESLIDQAKVYLDKTHAAERTRYEGQGKLQRRISEYRERFGLNLEEMPHYNIVREVTLARNCCIHKDSIPDDDYKKLTNQMLVDERGKINLMPHQLEQIIDNLKEFADGLITRLREVS